MAKVKSICVYCGSSNDVKPAYLRLAQDLGRTLAQKDIRLVYGGGGVGLMGACAQATHGDGGEVLGIMPQFLLEKERIYDEVPHEIVEDMHTRKQRMFDESDAFIVLPGGIGTLEEAIEVLSWARLGLHAKPMAFLDEDGFWDPLMMFLEKTIELKFNPDWMNNLFAHGQTPEGVIALLEQRVTVL